MVSFSVFQFVKINDFYFFYDSCCPALIDILGHCYIWSISIPLQFGFILSDSSLCSNKSMISTKKNKNTKKSTLKLRLASKRVSIFVRDVYSFQLTWQQLPIIALLLFFFATQPVKRKCADNLSVAFKLAALGHPSSLEGLVVMACAVQWHISACFWSSPPPL